MKCNDYRLLMMDALYDEISGVDKKTLDTHLKSCPDCRVKYHTLQTTTQTLKKWEDVEPHVNLTFVSQPASRIADFFRNLKSWKLPVRMGVAVASLLLLLSLFNTKIQITDGQFAFETSLFSRGSQTPSPELVTQTDLDNMRQENYQMVATILDEYAKRNKIETAVLFDKFYDELEKQRRTDLQLVSNAVEQVQYGTTQRLQRTDRTLGTLIEYVNMQSQGR
ncbi:zf-HC2 domain-containing protein [bacterium]|nr:zf-HC2 domain-containing protein [bacterium]MBU1872413.1 zf-HC2 domain-containing protein [bacterium]